MSGSVGAYVAQVDRVLGAGQGLFPASTGTAGVGAGGEPSPPAPPARSGLNVGATGAGEQYRGNWSTVSGLDAQTNGAAADGKAENERGRSAATGVRESARTQAAAIAPATGSPAGLKLLVSTMDERLAAMEREIATTKAQNRLLATRLRQLAMSYRMAIGAAGANPMAAMSGMTGGRGAAPASLGGLSGMPNFGALAGAPGNAMSALSGLPGGVQQAAMPSGGVPTLTANSSPHEVVKRIIWEAHRRGYSRAQTIAILSTAMQESALNPRASGGGGAWASIFQQDASYSGRFNPNLNIAEFFNRLATKGGPESPDIWKSIFWLQQRPGEESALAAYSNGRRAYLSEIQSQMQAAIRLYDTLTD